jgi:hypothetical protein
MFHLAMDWKKTRVVGAFLAVALLGIGRPAAATDPFRPGAFDEANAIRGFWKTLDTDEQGAFQPLGLLLKEDGRFTLAVADAQGKTIERVQGRYTYASGVLTLCVDKVLYAEMHVAFTDDALDLSTGAKKTHWVKDLARRE